MILITLSSEDADKAKEQYLEFLDTVVLSNQETFLTFNIEKDRLDTFLATHVYGVQTMFHGQSNVERGFNINNDIVVENLKKESLIAQRLFMTTCMSKRWALMTSC